MKPIVRAFLLAPFVLFAVACKSPQAQNPAPADSTGQNPYGTNPYYGQQTYPQNNPYQGSGDYTDVTPPPSSPTYQDPAPSYGGAPAGGPRSHVVAHGETLYRISKMYGTTVEDIKSANGLSSDLIHPGDVINIP